MVRIWKKIKFESVDFHWFDFIIIFDFFFSNLNQTNSTNNELVQVMGFSVLKNCIKKIWFILKINEKSTKECKQHISVQSKLKCNRNHTTIVSYIVTSIKKI